MTFTKRKIDPNKPRIRIPYGNNYLLTKKIVLKHNLNTICTSGNCPNINTCWNNKTATFMILGNICTRTCKFCSVKTGKPNMVDIDEPKRVANSIKLMGLKHCVITSVDRDDLEDGGSKIWAETIQEIRKQSNNITIETLIPDFNGDRDFLQHIIDVKPNIVSHNLETVERLTNEIRIKAKYKTSLMVLDFLKNNEIVTKSGIMVGLGETEVEIFKTMDDLLNVGCKILTIGQYLQPTKYQIEVKKYVNEDEFIKYKEIGLSKGFKIVESSSLVRSSFNADKHLL